MAYNLPSGVKVSNFYSTDCYICGSPTFRLLTTRLQQFVSTTIRLLTIRLQQFVSTTIRLQQFVSTTIRVNYNCIIYSLVDVINNAGKDIVATKTTARKYSPRTL